MVYLELHVYLQVSDSMNTFLGKLHDYLIIMREEEGLFFVCLFVCLFVVSLQS